MEWLIFELRETSRYSGIHTRRWKLNDQFECFFFARKYYKFGRFISIVTVHEGNRSVIIIPELAFNRGWVKIDKVH